MKLVRHNQSNWAGILAFAATVFFAGSALAGAKNDEAATELAKKAVFEDYLNLQIDDAVGKLTKAISLCEEECSPKVKARVFRDLGVIRIAAERKFIQGRAMFVNALRADPTIALDQDLATPEVEAEFAKAREQVPKPATPPASPDKLKTGTNKPVHTPPVEQTVNTPLPLHVEVPDNQNYADATIAKVFYRAFGGPQFSSRELVRDGNTFSGQIPCVEVGGAEVTFSYYIVVYTSDEDELVSLGSARTPFKVSLKKQIVGPAPSLPGEPAPQQCTTVIAAAEEDCPPGFPGCKSNADASSEVRVDDSPEAFSRHTVSLSFQQDLVFQSGRDVCGFHGDSSLEWECFDDNEQLRDPYIIETGNYELAPEIQTVTSGGGNFNAGFAAGSRRVLFGYAYSALEQLTVGARIGFAFGGGPQYITTEAQFNREPFVPVHAELEIGYWPAGLEGLVSPFFKLAGGVAQFDAKSRVEVVRGSQAERDECQNRDPSCLLQELDAWNKQGLGFIGANVGATIGSRDIALLLEARYFLSFASGELKSGSTIGASAGVQVGF